MTGIEPTLIDSLITQLGLAGVFAVALVFIFKIMWKKIEEKDGLIRELHREHKEFSERVIAQTVKSTENNTSALQNNTKAIEEMPKTITREVYEILRNERNNYNGA